MPRGVVPSQPSFQLFPLHTRALKSEFPPFRMGCNRNLEKCGNWQSCPLLGVCKGRKRATSVAQGVAAERGLPSMRQFKNPFQVLAR